MKINFISFAIGLSAGMFGGLIGLGGGLIMIPLMVEVLKLTQHKAHGTSLVALVFTGISGAITYALNGAIDITAAVLLALTAIFTAPLGARYAHTLAEWKLKKTLGVFLIFCSVLLLLKPFLVNFMGPLPDFAKIIVFLIAGVFTGFLSGMMGVGGGTIMVPVGGIGAFTHWKLGNVEAGILYGLIPGILLGTYLGGDLANIIPDNTLRLIFAVIIISLGFRYFKTSSPE